MWLQIANICHFVMLIDQIIACGGFGGVVSLEEGEVLFVGKIAVGTIENPAEVLLLLLPVGYLHERPSGDLFAEIGRKEIHGFLHACGDFGVG